MPPFVDNDPSKDWVQPQWLLRLPRQTEEDYKKSLAYFEAKERLERKQEDATNLGDYHAEQSKSEPALRYDGNKSRVDLIPPEFILALGHHFGVGAKKYAERNWEKGMSWSRCYASAMRHMLAFWNGEANDPETGSPHVICAAWNMCALHWYEAHGVGLDDRGAKAPSHGS
jgi:hypothetical protein